MERFITLSTDFGLKDSYVGTMKGVILSINPEVKIIDITQEISPYSLAQAAYLLKSYYSYFPQGTIHLIIVDPGVGTERQAILAKSKDYYFIAPDNGLLTYIFPEVQRAVSLTNRAYSLPNQSHTFRGRDIFAPVAAHLSKGISMEEFGPPIGEFVTLPELTPEIENDKIKGKVIHVDHFGNLITNITEDMLKSHSFLNLEIKGKKITGLKQNYAQGERGEAFAILGSLGHLEISVNCGRADELLSVREGDEVLLYLSG